MPKKPIMRTAVYDHVLDYFRNRYEESQSFRIRREKPDDRKYPTIESIVDYVIESENLCASNTGEEPTYGQRSISRGTIRKAIKQLIEENKIARSHGSYEFVPHMDRSLEHHPTLEIADKIDISIGVPDEIIVLSVPPEHAMSITNYLAALFYKGDILFIPIGGKILCISVFPQKTIQQFGHTNPTASKSIELRKRIEMAIHQFNYDYPSFTYGSNYEFAYHVSHNPSMVKEMIKESKKTADDRPYYSADIIFRSIQEGAFLMAECNDNTDHLTINPETGIEGDDEPLGFPDKHEWFYMDSTD